MVWLKGGDNAATHPALLAAGSTTDDRLLNEVAGFVLRCYLQSAGHMTDGVVDEGTAALLGGTRADALTRRAVQAGLMERLPGKPKRWQLLDDPEFMHIRLRADVEWERLRKRDIANEALTVPVRLRDGDECRYCGHVVNWRDRKGGRGGTYDHNPPGQPATVGGLFVACQRCNGTRGASADPDGLLPLRPQPMEPYFTAPSVAYLGERGHVVRPGAPRPGEQQVQQPAPSARPRTQRAEQQEQQAAPSATGAAGGAAGAAASAQRPDPQPAGSGAAGAAGSAQRPPVARDHQDDADPATGPPGPAHGPPAWAVEGPDPGPRPAGPADPRHPARDGSGRDGSGDPPPSPRLPSSTRPTASHAQHPPDGRPRARRRGGRGRGSKRTHEET